MAGGRATRVARRARALLPEPVELRLLSEERARQVCAGTHDGTEHWAIDYPTEGDLECATALLRELERGNPPGVFGAYEVLEAVHKTVIGGISFHAAPDAFGAVEVGYGIVDSEANRGYGTAALVALLGVARAHEVRIVRGRALPENIASRRVMEKAGLVYEGLADGYVCYAVALDSLPTEGNDEAR